MLTLTKRLQAVANTVNQSTLFCDVGTDHAYLPTYLLLTKKVGKAYASDIRKGPLDSARRTAIEYKVEDKMDLILSDGLDSISHDITEIAIAGMGGVMIADIIKRAEWLKDKKYHLVLQPMTKIAHLRKALYQYGFEIEYETAVVDDKRPYTVMSVRYFGKCEEVTELFSYIGKLSPKGDGKFYFEKQIKKLDRKINGLIKSENSENDAEIKRLTPLRDGIIEYLNKA